MSYPETVQALRDQRTPVDQRVFRCLLEARKLTRDTSRRKKPIEISPVRLCVILSSQCKTSVSYVFLVFSFQHLYDFRSELRDPLRLCGRSSADP